jgi:hypothetical protein
MLICCICDDNFEAIGGKWRLAKGPSPRIRPLAGKFLQKRFSLSSKLMLHFEERGAILTSKPIGKATAGRAGNFPEEVPNPRVLIVAAIRRRRSVPHDSA